jgi:hypothetical protein
VEAHAWAEMEDVGERIGRVPENSKPSRCCDCESVAKRGSRLVGLDSMRNTSEDGSCVLEREQPERKSEVVK